MNRKWKGLLGVASAALVTLTLTAGSANATTQPGWWSTEGYTAANSGFNPNEPTLTAAKVPSLKLKRTTTPAQSDQAAPVLEKGRVFVYSAAFVTAYDEVTGKQVWRHDQPHASDNRTGRMVVTGGKLVVAWNYGTAPYNAYTLEVLDAATGNVLVAPLRWSGTYGSIDRLLVDKGVVMISVETRNYPQSIGYSLSDGKQLWVSGFVMDQPVSANGRVLVRGWTWNHERHSQILDIRTGKVLVDVPNTWYDALTASPDGKKFYVAPGHSLQVLDATTGKLRLIASYVYPEYAALTPTRLYVTTTKHQLVAVDLSKNKIAWKKSYGTSLLRPIVAGGVLYVTASNGKLYALNPANGSSLKTPAFTKSSYPPVVTGARVYLTDGTKMSIYGL